jgi:hypothetical protein
MRRASMDSASAFLPQLNRNVNIAKGQFMFAAAAHVPKLMLAGTGDVVTLPHGP